MSEIEELIDLPLVKGWGPNTCEIMIVNDYPCKEETDERRAVVGFPARTITRFLRENNYSIEKCFKTSFIKIPFSMPKNKKRAEAALAQVRKDFAPLTFEKVLAQEILEVNPNVIISVGELPTNYLTGKRSITKLRGSVFPLSDLVRMDTGSPADVKPNTRVIPVLSPRDIAVKHLHNAYTSLDYAKAVRLRTQTDSIRDNSLIWIARDAKSLTNWWLDRGVKSEFLTLDIETYNSFITCISFCGDGYEALSVPLIDPRIANTDRALMLKMVGRILASPLPKVNQNIKYDHHILEEWGFNVNNIVGDTMLLGHSIYPELPKGLDFYTSLYTDIAYYKDDGRDFNPKQGWDVLYTYNAKDSLAAWQIYKKQQIDAKELKVWDFYQKKVWPCYAIYKKMDDRGIRIDKAEQDVLNVKYGEILATHESHLKRLINNELFNFNSPKQTAQLVYENLKFPEQRKRNAQGVSTLSTDEETLEELILNHSRSEEVRDILWNIIWCRKLYNIVNFINTPYHLDGRMRTSSKLTGTKSGRTSGSETVDRIWYKNVPEHPWYRKDKKSVRVLSRELGESFQKVPKHGIEIGDQEIGRDLRKIYVPSPGYTFVEGDGGQAEARVVAILAEDYKALDEMERTSFTRNPFGIKDDLHTKTAMMVLGKDFNEVTEVMRQDFGKKPRHAGNYDMGPKRLSLMAHISFAKAAACLSKFHAISPNIREIYHLSVRNMVTNSRILTTLHGRMRQFLDKLTEETFKQAYSHYPQAAVSDHTKFTTLIPLMRWTDEHEMQAFFLSESHDSLLFEVKNEQVEQFALKFKEFGETPLIFDSGSFIRDRQLIIPLEVKSSAENWYSLRELKF